jgi:potassium/hydrogen antiporter
VTEPLYTAFMLAVFGFLLLISVLSTRASERIGVPVVLAFLVLGMLAGSEGIGGIYFDNYQLAFRLGTLALVLILFDAGLNTSVANIRRAAVPAGILATVGVAMTAGLVALGARLFGLSWAAALILGAIVSSTDAAAVFAVLRGGSLNLKPRVGTVLEAESGMNDPMAVILTIALTQMVAGIAPLSWAMAWQIPLQLFIGAVVGILLAVMLRRILSRVRLTTGGLYPVLTSSLALTAFGVATILEGSGFLAAYAAGIALGYGRLPYRGGLVRVHDALGWLSQIGMFLMLGLLATPSRLPQVAGLGIALGLFLAFVARPLAVVLCIAPLGYRGRELVYISWVGLRGAVPIILATFPLFAGITDAERIFDLVLFIVVVSAIVPGATIRWTTRGLRLQAEERPAPAAVLEVNSIVPLNGEIISFHIDQSLAVADATLAQVPFPPGSSALLLVRGDRLEPCRGDTELRPGDHVYVYCRHEDRPLIELLFGRPQQPSEEE